MRLRTISLLLGLAVCATPVWAHNGKPSINKMEHRQQVRIRQGMRSGELTRPEARRLEAEQARIRVDERFAKSDGELTAKERAKLYQELHRASHQIYNQKHDNQDRD